MSVKGIGLKAFALIMAAVAIIAGVYLAFFHSAGFEKTQATIVSMEEIEDGDSTSHRVMVEYSVNGSTYRSELDSYSPSYRVGKTIEVLYDPKNPAVVHGGGFIGIYAIVVGIMILAVTAGTEVRKKKALREVKAKQAAGGGITYAASAPGRVRRLYFLTDLGTAKGGHRIEDEDGNILYEAKMTRFTLTAPYGFDFIDHEHGKNVPHLVGHEESTENNSLLFDNHYTFTFDDEDIWTHLKRNGIGVESSVTDGLRVKYRILRDGQEIANAVSSSPNVHGEDKGKLSSLIPVQGFYQIETTEQDLSLLFVTLMAFARSGATDDRGGNYKTLLNTIKGQNR